MVDSPFSTSPIDVMPVAEELTAHVISPGPRPRLHGYAVEDDLALHATFAEVMLTALTGELPSREVGRAFEIAMVFTSPIAVADAPAHAAVLAQISGARPSGVLATGAIALAEEATFLVAREIAVFEWLESPHGAPPDSILSEAPDDVRGADAIRAALTHAGLSVAALDHALAPWPARIALFIHCGLTRPALVATAIAQARWPVVAAEAFANHAGDFQSYPIRLPEFAYEHRRTEHEPS